MQTDLFQLVNNANIDYKDFLSRHYNFDWKKNGANFNTVCPFHDDSEKNPSLSYHPTKKILKCFVCEGGGGDLINFVRDYKKVSKLEACMKILDFENIYYERPDDTTVETKEERENRQKEFDKRQLEQNQKKQKEEKEEKEKKQKAIEYGTKKAHIFSQEFIKPKYIDLRNSMFPHAKMSSNFIDWEEQYIGYDTKHDSIAILNRINDEN